MDWNTIFDGIGTQIIVIIISIVCGGIGYRIVVNLISRQCQRAGDNAEQLQTLFEESKNGQRCFIKTKERIKQVQKSGSNSKQIQIANISEIFGKTIDDVGKRDDER